MNVVIERLKSKNIAGYKLLIDECFNGSNQEDIYAKSYDEKSDKYIILVAKSSDDTIVGSITLYRIDLFTFSFQPALEIFNVCVKKDYRGEKIAKKLFEETISFAKENQYKSIHLTCLDTATSAHRLYESLGMKKTNSVKYFLEL